MKLSSANNDETKQDFISKLPDALLTRILSLLPDADACRTSVLSKRWKDLWMFLPNLHFVIPNTPQWVLASEYYDLVEKILATRDGLPIRRFFLYGLRLYNIPRVDNWLRIAVQCKVQILELRFPPCRSWAGFHWDMFKTCETLVELTLEGQFCLKVPKDKVFFPCLKKISLVSILYRDDESFENLITTCCPVLEELFLERQELDNLIETIKISSISLKRLRIYNTLDFYEEFVIDAPKLEYLYIEDKKESGYSDYSFTKKPSSLVEAYIDSTNTDSVDQIITNISAVKVLTLTFPTITAFYGVDEIHDLDGLGVPVFPNLVKLVIDMHDISNWSLFFVFLHNMPNLEHITFLNGLLPIQNAGRIFHQYWKPPLEAPACLRFKLKEIIILNREAITQEGLTLIWYMLNHSDNLDILTVNGHELGPMRLEVLLKFHRGSNLCRFEIV